MWSNLTILLPCGRLHYVMGIEKKDREYGKKKGMDNNGFLEKCSIGKRILHALNTFSLDTHDLIKPPAMNISLG